MFTMDNMKPTTTSNSYNVGFMKPGTKINGYDGEQYYTQENFAYLVEDYNFVTDIISVDNLDTIKNLAANDSVFFCGNSEATAIAYETLNTERKLLFDSQGVLLNPYSYQVLQFYNGEYYEYYHDHSIVAALEQFNRSVEEDSLPTIIRDVFANTIFTTNENPL